MREYNYDERIEALGKLDPFFTTSELASAWNMNHRHVQLFMKQFREIYAIPYKNKSVALFYKKAPFVNAYRLYVNRMKSGIPLTKHKELNNENTL